MLHADQRIVDAVMAILLDAGFSESEALLAYAMIHTYLFGRYQVTMAPSAAVETESATRAGAGDTAPRGIARRRLLQLRHRHPHRRAPGQARGVVTVEARPGGSICVTARWR